MLPLRLVIDTNVLVSAALKPEGLSRTALILTVTKPALFYVSHYHFEGIRGCALASRVGYPQRDSPAIATARQESQPYRDALPPT